MHPFKHHAHVKSQHRRVAKILEEEPRGRPKKSAGGATKLHMRHHPARGNDSEAEMSVEGSKGRHRFKRGGKVKHQTNIVIVGHHKPDVGMMPASAPGAMPAGPPPGAMGPGPALPPGLPAAPVGPMVARKHGGKVSHHDFYDPPEDISSYRQAHARGGEVLAGASTGIGREQAFHRMQRKHH